MVVTQSTGRVSAEALLTELYEQHSAAVFRYALHLTGRREDAEDVVQHVFIQAFRQLEDGVELVNPLAWLMTSTKYRSLNVIRDRREIPTDGTGFDALAAPESDGVEAGELAAVRSMLWALPESQHQAFVLRHWSGLSQTEIADVLSTTTSAVESLLVRARGALLDDRDQADGECRTARQALVDSRQLVTGESSHVEHCRRCRTARSRLLRATEFATVLALVPRPHVAHAIASVVPGFSATAGAGSIGTAAGAATGSTTAGATAISSSVPLAAKGTVAAKALAAVMAATVAVSAVQPIRQPIVNTIMHHLPGHASSQHRMHAAATGGISKNSPAPAAPRARPEGRRPAPVAAGRPRPARSPATAPRPARGRGTRTPPEGMARPMGSRRAPAGRVRLTATRRASRPAPGATARRSASRRVAGTARRRRLRPAAPGTATRRGRQSLRPALSGTGMATATATASPPRAGAARRTGRARQEAPAPVNRLARPATARRRATRPRAWLPSGRFGRDCHSPPSAPRSPLRGARACGRAWRASAGSRDRPRAAFVDPPAAERPPNGRARAVWPVPLRVVGTRARWSCSSSGSTTMTPTEPETCGSGAHELSPSSQSRGTTIAPPRERPAGAKSIVPPGCAGRPSPRLIPNAGWAAALRWRTPAAAGSAGTRRARARGCQPVVERVVARCIGMIRPSAL